MSIKGTSSQQVFRMLTEERKSYDLAVKALKKRFRPIDTEELRGLEFHQKMKCRKPRQLSS